ncbi:MAG: hypothetical protein LBJ39_05355 [Tannerellaceae bacterium]|jgi:hypothetical protein|nr:hypothetical protein [Tannerellaceae bacterium]
MDIYVKIKHLSNKFHVKQRCSFFNTAGTKFELYPPELLAHDISETNPPAIGNGFGGITLAYNVKTEEEVHEIIELARESGAIIVKEPQFDEKDMVVL